MREELPERTSDKVKLRIDVEKVRVEKKLHKLSKREKAVFHY